MSYNFGSMAPANATAEASFDIPDLSAEGEVLGGKLQMVASLSTDPGRLVKASRRNHVTMKRKRRDIMLEKSLSESRHRL